MKLQSFKRYSLALVIVPLLLAGCGGSASGTSSSTTKSSQASTIVNHTPPPLEYGWTLASVKNEGFAIGLPPGWVKFDLSQNDIQSGFSEMQQANPSLASSLSGEMASMAAQGIKLFAVDKYGNFASTGFATNLNVIKLPLPGDVSLDELSQKAVDEIKQQLHTDTPIQFFKNRMDLNSGEALRLQYTININKPTGGSLDVSFTQYLAVADGSYYVVTFTTTDNEFPTYASAFDKSAKTLTFLK